MNVSLRKGKERSLIWRSAFVSFVHTERIIFRESNPESGNGTRNAEENGVKANVALQLIGRIMVIAPMSRAFVSDT
jgi:hypothetical protein